MNHLESNELEQLKGVDGYKPGSDLRTQMIKVSLDFTDDIRDIIKRILLMRKDLKKAKTMADSYNTRSIFAGASYKSYDNSPSTNRPSHLIMSEEPIKSTGGTNDERILMDET